MNFAEIGEGTTSSRADNRPKIIVIPSGAGSFAQANGPA
jgi:hypothetical protein